MTQFYSFHHKSGGADGAIDPTGSSSDAILRKLALIQESWLVWASSVRSWPHRLAIRDCCNAYIIMTGEMEKKEMERRGGGSLSDVCVELQRAPCQICSCNTTPLPLWLLNLKHLCGIDSERHSNPKSGKSIKRKMTTSAVVSSFSP